MAETYGRPKPPIPEPLRGIDEVGSFTYDSIVERLPEIGQRTLKENDFPPGIAARLKALFDGIPQAALPPLQHADSPGAGAWARYLEPHAGQNWLEAPWFTIETYFYRLILDLIGYYQPASPCHHYDPFQHQKMEGLENGRATIRRMCEQARKLAQEPPGIALRDLLKLNLWGNQADLSMWPAGGQGGPEHGDDLQRDAHLLVDSTEAVSRFLLNCTMEPVRINFLVDNAGMELVADLFLTDHLLTQLPQSQVLFHVKDEPTFVSDALPKDVQATIDFLRAMDSEHIRSLGDRLQDYLQAGRLSLRTDPFWTSPLPGWEMPAGLRKELGRAALLISKGDAHYRRLLGDRHWPYTTPLTDVLRYLPTPLAALRVCKSEIVAGMPAGKVETMHDLEPDWLYNGKWAVIQFYRPDSA